MDALPVGGTIWVRSANELGVEVRSSQESILDDHLLDKDAFVSVRHISTRAFGFQPHQHKSTVDLDAFLLETTNYLREPVLTDGAWDSARGESVKLSRGRP